MVLLGVILVLLAAAAGVVLVAGTAQLTDSVQIDVLGGTLSIPPLTLLITGMVVISVFWLGWALLRGGLRRGKRRRVEAKEAAAAAEAKRVEEQKRHAGGVRHPRAGPHRGAPPPRGGRVPGRRPARATTTTATGCRPVSADTTRNTDRGLAPPLGSPTPATRRRRHDRVDRPARLGVREAVRRVLEDAGLGTATARSARGAAGLTAARRRPRPPGLAPTPRAGKAAPTPVTSGARRTTATTHRAVRSRREPVSTAPLAAATDAPTPQSTPPPLAAGPAAASAARSAAARARWTSRTTPLTTSTPVSTRTTAATAPTVSTVALPRSGPPSRSHRPRHSQLH